jgi:TatD DNase family protein
MAFVDAHCHLDLYQDPAAVASSAETSKTYTIAVTNSPGVFARTERIAEGKRYVRPAAGLHPELVCSRKEDIEPLLSLLSRVKYVGEIGLDYSHATSEERQFQRRTLERIVARCEDLGGRVLSIHSRRAAADAVAIAGSARRCKVILHWFSGSLSAARSGIAAGCFFSVNPAMLRSASGSRLLSEIPDGSLLTESDGPFVANGARPFEPAAMFELVESLARMRGVRAGELGRSIIQNFARAVDVPEQEDRAGSST